MLPLCPGDNMKQRDWLGPLLIRIGRPADALSFCQLCIQTAGTGVTLVRGGAAFRPPSDNLLTPELLPSQKQSTQGPPRTTWRSSCASPYARTPPFSSRLSGAVSTWVCFLFRVLSRLNLIRTQVEGRLTGCEFNGQDDAHNYLWIA
ncbi:hypothetical protein DFH09DRAFT_156518 [Mycena vulgaris]|nr:hypothetical protein DFH09DRAFT_156518 [Mycena vulgaris]